MSNETDLLTLLPLTARVLVREGTEKEEEVVVSPLKFKQFTSVTKHVIALRGTILRSMLEEKAVKSNEDDEELPIDFMSLLSENGEDIGEIIRISVNKDSKWMDDLDLVDVVKLAAAVVKVNKDFFFQRLAPVMKALVAGLKM